MEVGSGRNLDPGWDQWEQEQALCVCVSMY